ncbi:MAG: sortase [Candidatus Peregrinibacteria bacterium]
MIPPERTSRRQRASVDPEGNIILSCEEANAQTLPPPPPSPPPPPVRRDEAVPPKVTVPKLSAILRSMRSSTTEGAEELMEESARQYRTSVRSVFEVFRTTSGVMRGSSQRLWAFLTQPVWIVRPRKVPKRYSRLSLFAFDTVRFGGTFAALFVMLFMALNYQSFWKILQSRLDPLQEIKSQVTLGAGTSMELREKLLKSPALTTAGAQGGGDLLSYLPPVGPPENHLIVPKLNLNVPIVIPAIDALLREDWTQVETDIQSALEGGVVHYPGTAKPGQAGNFFITGHSSYYPWAPGKYKTVFARLHDLAVGDEYWVYYGGDKHRYVVQAIDEVKPANVDVLNQPLDRRMSTLMTCTPVGTTLHRLIVTADEVDPETGEMMAVGQQPAREQKKVRAEMLPI